METNEIRFDSAGTQCVGQIYLPDAEGRRPCIVLCAGFGGTQDTPAVVAAAQAFVNAGYVAVTFDYRNFGLSSGEPRQLVDIAVQIADIHAVICRVRGLPAVDPERIALWGTSLGGGHVVTVAAADHRIAAVVAQVPFNGFPKRVEGRSARATLALLWAMVRDRLRGWIGRDPYYIPAVGEMNELAVMASPHAAQAVAGLDSRTWQNKVAPRALLDMMRYKPGRYAPRLRMPVLVCIGEFDKETAGVDSAEIAERAPGGQLRSYPFAHFDFYRSDIRERVIADQLEFLNRAIDGSTPAPGGHDDARGPK